MTAANNPTRVVAVGEPNPTQEQIINALGASAQTDFQLVDVIVPGENMVRDVRSADPLLVVVDYQTGEKSILDVIDELSLQIPEVSVIAIIPGNDPLIAQQVMLAGARAFIVHPFTQVNLLSTLRRVRDLESRHLRYQPAKPQLGENQIRPIKTIAVYSPRGGAGCSTVAVNLAIALREKTNQQVLLLGGKLFFGHLGLMLNLRTNNSIADLVPHAAQLDDALINDVVSKHVSGIHVLLEPFDFQVAQGIRPQDLYSIFVGIKRVYDYIVIDSGSWLSENVVTQMDAADRVLLVTTPDLSSLHDTRRFLEISHSLEYGPEKILVVLNRSGLIGGIKSSDIHSALNRDLFTEIPNDDAKVLRSLNRGIPLISRYPRCPASKAIRALADKLEQQVIAESAIETAAAIPSPI
jgi:pilus assembly protein CpaE